MLVRRVEAHPSVAENGARVALMRGPLLYCAEEVDNIETDLRTVIPEEPSEFESRFESDVLGGVVTLSAPAIEIESMSAWRNTLYREKYSAGLDFPVAKTLELVPYFAWANREPGRMRVWIGHKRSPGLWEVI